MSDGLSAAIALNRKRLENQAADARAAEFRWLVESRELGDAYDRDARVYFVPCEDDKKVLAVISPKGPDNPYDRVLGVFDLEVPLSGQGGGVRREDWLAGVRPGDEGQGS